MSKFCINCAYMKARNAGKFGGRVCAHPSLRGEPDPVYGHQSYADMRKERGENGRCGPSGALFQQATPRKWWRP